MKDLQCFFSFIFSLMFLINSCGSSTSSKQNNLIENHGTHLRESNYPIQIIGSFIGQQVSYNLKNKNGDNIILFGNPVIVPSYFYQFTIMENGTVIIVQDDGRKKILYNGTFKVIKNSSTIIQVLCEVSTIDKTSNPTFTLDYYIKSNLIFCKGTGEPTMILKPSNLNAKLNTRGNRDSTKTEKGPNDDGINYSETLEDRSIKIQEKITQKKNLISSKDENYAKELLDRINESIIEGDNNVLDEIFENEINFHGKKLTTLDQIKRQIEAYKKRWKVNSNTITKIKFISSNKYEGLFHYYKDYSITRNNERGKTINYLIEGDVIIDFESGKIISINDTKTLK